MPDPDLIQQHPEFPFRPGRTDRLGSWANGFVLPDDSIESETLEVLREFLGLVDCYAFIERIVQGEIRYELPMHSPVVLQSGGPVLEEDGERIARLELEALGEPDTPAMDLYERLEDLGIKTLTSTGEHAREDLHGFFLFEGRVGPAFAVDRVREDRQASFVLAHLLGHLAMDVNPYRNRVCCWSSDLVNRADLPVERRADRFARALLLPEARLRLTLEQIAAAVQRGETKPGLSWILLHEIYEVPPRLLARRFEDLGLGTLGRQMSEAAPPAGDETSYLVGDAIASGSFFLPQRYLNLALACYHEEVMDERLLARFLGLSVAEARRVVRSSGIAGGQPARPPMPPTNGDVEPGTVH